MSCLPGYGGREQRLMRAFHHYVYRNHDFIPATCGGCLEAAAFLTQPGYQGDTDDPTCVVVYDDCRARNERTGLKHGHSDEERPRDWGDYIEKGERGGGGRVYPPM